MARREGTEDSVNKRKMHGRIGGYLKEARQSAGITQRALADELDLTTAQYVSNIERGISPPSVDYLKTIKSLCGVSRGELANKISFEMHKYYMDELK